MYTDGQRKSALYRQKGPYGRMVLAEARQFRVPEYRANRSARLLVHCIINNLLNRRVSKNRDSTGRTKVSKRPRGSFYVKVSGHAIQTRGPKVDSGVSRATRYKIFTPPCTDEVIQRCAIGGGRQGGGELRGRKGLAHHSVFAEFVEVVINS